MVNLGAPSREFLLAVLVGEIIFQKRQKITFSEGILQKNGLFYAYFLDLARRPKSLQRVIISRGVDWRCAHGGIGLLAIASKNLDKVFDLSFFPE